MPRVLDYRVHQGKGVAPWSCTKEGSLPGVLREGEFIINNLLVRIHFIIEMIWWTGIAPWEFEFPFPGSLRSTFLRLTATPPPAPLASGSLPRTQQRTPPVNFVTRASAM